MELVRPDGWLRGQGYSDGVLAEGKLLVLAGQIGWDPATQRLVAPDLPGQAAQALRNVADLLRAGGGRAEDLVRLTWYVADRAAYVAARREIGEAYRAHFGRHYPAMSVVLVAGLLDEGALVEIEATAVIPRGGEAAR
jgi:enamine deaminase RidA (YjgF/YER057c/UK114 family)